MRYEHIANAATILMASFGAVALVIRLGQVFIFRSIDWPNSPEPITDLGRVTTFLNFIVYPLAALTGGALVSILNLRLGPTAVACAVVLGPLWLARLASDEITALASQSASAFSRWPLFQDFCGNFCALTRQLRDQQIECARLSFSRL